jgi:hypothetical protein
MTWSRVWGELVGALRVRGALGLGPTAGGKPGVGFTSDCLGMYQAGGRLGWAGRCLVRNGKVPSGGAHVGGAKVRG